MFGCVEEAEGNKEVAQERPTKYVVFLAYIFPGVRPGCGFILCPMARGVKIADDNF